MASRPTHLVCLFLVTAGQNDENLGADEEQIVEFVYLLYDLTNNKVGLYPHAFPCLKTSKLSSTNIVHSLLK